MSPNNTAACRVCPGFITLSYFYFWHTGNHIQEICINRWCGHGTNISECRVTPIPNKTVLHLSNNYRCILVDNQLLINTSAKFRTWNHVIQVLCGTTGGAKSSLAPYLKHKGIGRRLYCYTSSTCLTRIHTLLRQDFYQLSATSHKIRNPIMPISQISCWSTTSHTWEHWKLSSTVLKTTSQQRSSVQPALMWCRNGRISGNSVTLRVFCLRQHFRDPIETKITKQDT